MLCCISPRAPIARASSSWPAIFAPCSRPAPWCGRARSAPWLIAGDAPARHHPGVPVRAAARSGPLDRVSPPAAERCRGVGVRRGSAAAARVLPRLPLRPSSPHPGSRARSGAGGAEAAHACRLPVARLGPALLARAARHDRAPRARARRRAVHRAAAAARRSCARRGCCSACICWQPSARSPCRARPALPVGRAGPARPAISAPVPARRAHRLPAGGEHARELEDHAQPRTDPPARLEHALPCRAPRLSGAAVPCAAGGAPAPADALPAAHRLLQARIAVQAPGYVAVHREILAGLRRGDAAPDQAALSRSVRRS